MNWLDRFLAMLEKYLPAFLLGYQFGQRDKDKLVVTMTKMEKEKTDAKIDEETSKHNSNLSDDELRTEIVSRQPRPNGKSTKF